MPVATVEKVVALSHDFGSQRRLANLLDVSPAQLTRWKRGQGIDPANAERVDLLELVMSRFLRIYSVEAVEVRLVGFNPHVGDRGRAGRQLRVKLWRVFAWDVRAAPHEPGGAVWFPRQHQGEGRHDNPDLYGCLYVSEHPISALAEQLAPFRRAGRLSESMLMAGGRPLALARIVLDDQAGLVDLDDPLALCAEKLRPSLIATRRRPVTQVQAARLWMERQQAAGIRWWSTLEASWINVTRFDRAAIVLAVEEVQPLGPEAREVRDAADLLGLRLA